ncbi:MAG: hypothetical protein J6X44_00065 [Thermoguttaceae bacterium]|nr:hypothetical protein [Thermoguttaceae bacterium]
MTREEAKRAYHLAYLSALGTITKTEDGIVGQNQKRPTRQFEKIVVEKHGLSKDEAERIWRAACDDLWRRLKNWRDDMIATAENYAETYALIYQTL